MVMCCAVDAPGPDQPFIPGSRATAAPSAIPALMAGPKLTLMDPSL